MTVSWSLRRTAVALASIELELLFLSTSSSRACATRRTPVASHALEGSIRPKAQEMLLAFMCDGEHEIDEGQLTER